VLVEDIDQLCEVRERSGQSVNFINDDDVDLSRRDFGEEFL